jgi:N utilization substance protein B
MPPLQPGKTVTRSLLQLSTVLTTLVKTPTDPRHRHRIKLFKQLFSRGFRLTTPPPKEIQSILAHLKKIDRLITQSAPDWPIDKLNKTDLAILRLAIYELTISKKNPPKVIIDEAIEIAKEYGSEKTPQFVNGVLGAILKKQSSKQSS